LGIAPAFTTIAVVAAVMQRQAALAERTIATTGAATFLDTPGAV
jgi:hypothetical protein